MTYQAKNQDTPSLRFVIGWVGNACHFTNMPTYEQPTNAALLNMSDVDLEKLAYAPDGSVRTEKYQRPSGGKDAEAQGGEKSETYYAPCRAVCVLKFRAAQKSYKDEKNFVAEHPIQERDNWKEFVKAFLEANPNYKYPKVWNLINKYSFAPEEVGAAQGAW